MEYLTPFVNEFITDTYGTAVAVINPESNFKVIIDAHSDEISWYVNFITDNGLLYVIPNGGSDHQIAPSKWVNIHTGKGIVTGIFGWPAIHTRKQETEEAPKLHNIFIDIGANSKKEVEKMGVHVGCMVTYPDEFQILNKNKFVSRGLDNHIGGFMVAEVGRLIHKNKIRLPYGLYITNSVQEEIGLRGAQMISSRLEPDVVLVTDVCHDTTTPMMSKIKEGNLSIGAGPVISYDPSIQNKLRERIIETAIKSKIPFQRNASSRSTHTNNESYAFSNGGVPSALISLPLRYMHTTVETVHLNDVENVISLLYETLLNIKANETFSYYD